jgi:phosphonoacetate hydrolase
MYLSTTDYVQHKAAPGSDFANAFYAMMDRYVGELDAAGAVLVLTADHGMNDKHLPNGEPDVIYLQNLTDEWLGKASRACCCRSPIRTWCITARSAPTRRSICPTAPT